MGVMLGYGFACPSVSNFCHSDIRLDAAFKYDSEGGCMLSAGGGIFSGFAHGVGGAEAQPVANIINPRAIISNTPAASLRLLLLNLSMKILLSFLEIRHRSGI